MVCALEEKIRSLGTLAQIPAIISSFRENIQTDLTPAQTSQLAFLGTTMPHSNIYFASFPRELFNPGTVYDPIAKQDVFIWKSDFNEMREYVSRFAAGTWPTVSTAFGTPEPDTSRCE